MSSFNPDSAYVQDCRQVQSNTHAIQMLTGQISKQVAVLSSQQDLLQCRGNVDNAVQQAKDTKDILSRIREHQRVAQDQVEKNNRRMMYRKLSDNLAVTARVLEDVVRRYQAEEAKFESLPAKPLAGADAAGGSQLASDLLPLIDTEQGPQSGPGGVAQQTQHFSISDQDLSEEKGTALRRVDEDMRCLQKIYTDLATAVEESQSTFESLETHMAAAAEDVERGRLEVEVMSPPLGAKLKEKGVIVGIVVAVLMVGSYAIG